MEVDQPGWEQLEEQRMFEEEFQPDPKWLAEMKRLKANAEAWWTWATGE